jgi:hypothetical protein
MELTPGLKMGGTAVRLGRPVTNGPPWAGRSTVHGTPLVYEPPGRCSRGWWRFGRWGANVRQGVSRSAPSEHARSLDGGGAADGWSSAAIRAALVLVLSVVGFVLVPDRIVTYLSEHARPSVRDLATLVWVLGWFTVLSWLVTRLQRRRT